MKKMYLLILAITMMLGSCSVRTNTSREIKTAKTVVFQKKLIADLEVDVTKKITGSAVVKLTGIDQVSGPDKIYERAKNMAKWDAILKSNADAIADPIYNINQQGNKVTIEVQGFYASYKSIDIATHDDMMSYIGVRLSSGTGILGVTLEQFKAFYIANYEKYDIPEEDKLSEYALESLYYEYYTQAQALEKQNNKTERQKKGIGKKILKGYLIATGISLFLVILGSI
jgi:hypothetical protein